MLNTREQVVEGVSEQFEKSKKLKEWIAGGPDYTFLEYEKPSQTTFNINFMK